MSYIFALKCALQDEKVLHYFLTICSIVSLRSLWNELSMPWFMFICTLLYRNYDFVIIVMKCYSLWRKERNVKMKRLGRTGLYDPSSHFPSTREHSIQRILSACGKEKEVNTGVCLGPQTWEHRNNPPQSLGSSSYPHTEPPWPPWPWVDPAAPHLRGTLGFQAIPLPDQVKWPQALNRPALVAQPQDGPSTELASMAPGFKLAPAIGQPTTIITSRLTQMD